MLISPSDIAEHDINDNFCGVINKLLTYNGMETIESFDKCFMSDFKVDLYDVVFPRSGNRRNHLQRLRAGDLTCDGMAVLSGLPLC